MSESSDDPVEAILQACRDGAIERLSALPDLPPEGPLSLHMAWRDVRTAYVLRQYAAALLLGTTFIELLLRTLLSPPARSTLEKMISKAVTAGLLDEIDGNRLHSIRTFIRNRYAHGMFEDIAGRAPVKITTVRMKSGVVSVEEVTCTTADHPILQARQKLKHDALFADKALPHIHRIASRALENFKNSPKA